MRGEGECGKEVRGGGGVGRGNNRPAGEERERK